MACGSVLPGSAGRCPRCGEVATVFLIDAAETPGADSSARVRTLPRRAVSFVAALVVAWGALWLARPDQQAPLDVGAGPAETAAARAGQPPADLRGDYPCPAAAPFASFVGQVYYPPNHPLFPSLRIRPERCFAAPADAERAGYAPAPPPEGSRVVMGVYLIPVGPLLAGQCLDAARALGFAIACPALLPAPGYGVSPPSCPSVHVSVGRCVEGTLFALEYRHFALPPGYQNGAAPGSGGDLVLLGYRASEWAGTDGSLRLCPPNRHGSTLIVGGAVVDGAQAYLEVCTNQGGPDEHFFLSGHVFLHWWRRGVTYDLGIWGDTRANRAILLALIPFITYVSPR